MDAYLGRWLEELLATPGVTGLRDREKARRFLLDDALRALPLLERLSGDIIDVGSGGGVPGIPLATRLPHRDFTLLEADRGKCDFLARQTQELANVTVVWGRAEGQPIDVFGVALAKALAKPPVAVELCVPLVKPEGAAILWLGETADLEAVAAVAQRLNARLERAEDGLAVIRKLDVTPAGFPRRAGMAKKRPLA